MLKEYRFPYDVGTVLRWQGPGGEWTVMHNAVVGDLAVYAPHPTGGREHICRERIDQTLPPEQITQVAERLRDEVQARIEDGQL